MTVSLSVKYEAGHSYNEQWEKSDYFCPRCGAGDSEWFQASCGGDYYVGETHLCLKCEAHFYLPTDPRAQPENWQDKQRLEAIRAVLDTTK